MARKGLIKIFSEISADDDNTNAQSLTVRQIVSRLDPERFLVTMTQGGAIVDPILRDRPNTRFLRRLRHGTAAKFSLVSLSSKPDIFFYPAPSPVTQTFLWARRLLPIRTKLVVHVVGTFGLMKQMRNDWFGGNSVQEAIRAADFVAANSHGVARDVQNEFDINVPVIHNGIDRRYFYPPSQPRCESSEDPRLRVLFVGSFKPYKRTKSIVEIASKYDQVTFWLVGDGPERKECERAAETLRNVVFFGTVPPARVGELMRQADIFLFPSVVEGHPQVLGQAGACGLPCVARDTYAPDYVVNGGTGLLSSSEEDLLRNFEKLIRDQDMRCRLGNAAIEHTKQFDWDKSAHQWAEVFLRLAEGAN